jgi:iron(III) transport system substrate-binding protein
MKKYLILAASLALAAFVVTGCAGTSDGTSDDASSTEAVESADKLVVYSSRKEDFVQPLIDAFAEETGIEVDVLHGDGAVINRLREESGNVQADILISNDAGALEFLRLEGVLAGIDDLEGIDTIAPEFRAEDNSWVGLSARTRVLMYNTELISEDDMPKTMEELADLEWNGRFAITRGGNGSMIAHVSALRAQWGDEDTQEWLEVVKDNAGAITDGHTDIRKAVGAGEFEFGLVNNYYFHQQLREPTDNAVAAIYPDQGEGEMGAFVNAAGIGFVADGPNSEAARKFAEWVLIPENQALFVSTSLEVPLNPDVEAAEEAAAIDSYNVMDMPLGELGVVWEDTRELIERAGLDLELK